MLQPTLSTTLIGAGSFNVLVVGEAMGVKAKLAATVVAPAHLSAALKAGRYPVERITQAQQQAQDLIITLREIINDMQTGDVNITAFQTLITNLS